MISAADWRAAPRRQVVLFGMSGLGKTHVAKVLRGTGAWFHYSIDYRIGTRHLGEAIADNAKAMAMQVPFLRDLLKSDSIAIEPRVTFENLDPVSSWLGKPGDPARGGLPWPEFQRRQAMFRAAEVAAMLETPHFADRATRLYGYPHMVCDTGGSICEWVDPDDPTDPIMACLSAQALCVWIEGTDDHTAELIARFDRAPKPMAYHPDFLAAAWAEFRDGRAEASVDPDAFIRWTYARALAHRQPRYRAMAARWGVTVPAAEMAAVRTEDDFVGAVDRALDREADRMR